MYKSLFPIILLLASSLCWGCEEVIVLELEENAGLLVVEGIVSSEPGQSLVSLTQSVGFYEENVFPGVQGAKVSITDGDGQNWDLTETSPGTYSHPDLVGQPEKTYTLNVELEGKIYTASSTMPPVVKLDSLVIQPLPGGGGLSDSVILQALYRDPESYENFYRFKVKRNGDFIDALILNDDVLNNGILAATPLFGAFFSSGDEVEVSLLGLDQPVYRYFNTLSSVNGGAGLATGAVADPESNLSNGALGFFSAQTQSQLSITIP
ncbi:MAG: DUF4249 domain-containing protein [Bacteroidota bacterium]